MQLNQYVLSCQKDCVTRMNFLEVLNFLRISARLAKKLVELAEIYGSINEDIDETLLNYPLFAAIILIF